MWPRSSPRRSDQRLGLVGGLGHQRLDTLLRGRRSGRGHAGRRPPGRSNPGRPTPALTRQNSAPPSPRRRLFKPLWPASPPPCRTVRRRSRGRSHRGARRHDRVGPAAPARRSGGRAGLVHVGLGDQQRTGGPPGAGLADQPAVALPGGSAAPSGAPTAADPGAGYVCAGFARSGARVAEADDQDALAPRPLRGLSAGGGRSRAGLLPVGIVRARLGGLCSASAAGSSPSIGSPRPSSASSSSSGSGSSSTRAESVAIVTSSGSSATNRTLRAGSPESCRVSLISIAETSTTIRSGNWAAAPPP